MLFVLDEWKNWVEAESKETQTKIRCIFYHEYNSNWTSMTSNKVEVVFPLQETTFMVLFLKVVDF